MIVAFPVSGDEGINSQISRHFGRANYFLLVKFTDGKVDTVEVLKAPPHAFGAFPQFLEELGVRVVVCDGIGEKALEMLKTAGIEVFSGFSGEVSDVIPRITGKVREIEERDREEEAKKEKARKALERARESMLSFWVDAPLPGNENEEGFFISVDVGDNLVLSFDNTVKGRRVIVQKRIRRDVEYPDRDPDAEYRTLHFYGPRLVSQKEVKWWDLGGRDQVNDEIWETIWEGELPDDVREDLQGLVNQLLDNLDGDDVKEKARALNDFLYRLVQRYARILEEIQS